jgi:two-component system, LytTR family, response regulator
MGSADVVTSGRLPLKETGRTVFVPLLDVEYLEADGNYVRVHAGSEHYFVREKLSNFETRLRGDFVRIHRSIIVNRNCVHELRRLLGGSYVLTLISGKQLKLSRTYRRQFQTLDEMA